MGALPAAAKNKLICREHLQGNCYIKDYPMEMSMYPPNVANGPYMAHVMFLTKNGRKEVVFCDFKLFFDVTDE